VYDVSHFSFADGTNHAARFVVVGIFKCVHQYLGLYTFSPTLFALASHNRVECSSRLEHLTVYDLAHSSFVDGINHAARHEVRGIFKSAHQYLGLYNFSHFLRTSFSPLLSMQLKFGASYGA